MLLSRCHLQRRMWKVRCSPRPPPRTNMAFQAPALLRPRGACAAPHLRRGLCALPRTPRPATASTTTRMVQSEVRADATVDLDWPNLGFSYVPTRCYMSATWKDGAWGPLEPVFDPYVRLHIGATVLHYGQSCFEGLKAFRRRDGSIALFRPDENARRMRSSAARLLIPEVPAKMFIDACVGAVRENAAYVPPYGTGGSLYVRPLLFGAGPKIGLGSSDEFTFLVLVTPVSDYYRGGLAPVTALLMQEFDRAAPRGVGNVKVSGNYAADLLPATRGKQAGYPINLYLDARNRRTIEEFGTSNFLGLKGNTYVTPKSESILPSITNKTLMDIAKDLGMKVEQREVDIDELEEFDEVGACGTAVVITAVTRVVVGSKVVEIGNNPDEVGEKLQKLYQTVRAIQFGEVEDTHGWCLPVDVNGAPAS